MPKQVESSTVNVAAGNQGPSNMSGNSIGGLGAAPPEPPYQSGMHELKTEDVRGIAKQPPRSAIWRSYYDDGIYWVGIEERNL